MIGCIILLVLMVSMWVFGYIVGKYHESKKWEMILRGYPKGEEE